MWELMAAGYALQGISQVMSTQGQVRSLSAQAGVAEKNADLAILQAKFNAQNQVIQSQKQIAAGEAGYAASGVSGGGSVFAVIADSMINAELDRLSIIHGGDVRAANFRNQAASAKQASRDASAAGFFNVLSTGFMAAGSAAKYGGGGSQDLSNLSVTEV